MSNPNTYKWCIVPKCVTTTVSSPEKLFFKVPFELKMRKKWMRAIKRDNPPSNKSSVYCCEDHFDVENDMENYIKFKLVGGRIQLKKGVLPHKFQCQINAEEKAERSAVDKRNPIPKEDPAASSPDAPEEIFFASDEEDNIEEDPLRLENEPCMDKSIRHKAIQVRIKNQVENKATITQEKFFKKGKNTKELVERVIQLEAHCTQLKNIISKNLQNESEIEKNEKKKPYDFTKCHFRRVLLRILYFGWDYNGLAVQEDSNQTIEHHLFNALTRTCLIESRETSQYHRCGRTDKGVSAFGQVISITLRSKLLTENQHEIASELPYCKMLNRLLPKEIRAVAWMPIPADQPEFSARFDCKRRVYKYYFPRADLDLPAMRDACRHLIGSRDFRHLCKMDVGNGVTEFIRNIVSADILPVDCEGDSPTTMYYLKIEGNAFLWHQIRCIMGVLLLVGQRKESPDIMSQLLNVENIPRKPQYNMALDVPLNLFHTSYDIESDWFYDREELKVVICHLQAEWTMHSVKTTMIKDCLQQLESEYQKVCENGTDDTDNSEMERDNSTYSDCLLQGVKPKVYTPLLKRETCSSLEERIEYYRKKRKLDDKK